MKSILLIPMIALAVASMVGCGQDTDTDRTNNPPPPNPVVPGCAPNCDAGMAEPDRTGVVTRCLGPSCPRGECGFSNECSAYQGFDALDSSQLCGAATGAKQFCLQYEVPRDDGFVDIFEHVVSCADPTVLQISCYAGCGYNYAPDDCAVCNGESGCAID